MFSHVFTDRKRIPDYRFTIYQAGNHAGRRELSELVEALYRLEMLELFLEFNAKRLQ